jgi:hypothetical protein
MMTSTIKEMTIAAITPDESVVCAELATTDDNPQVPPTEFINKEYELGQ